MNGEPPERLKHDFKLERLKFVLLQIDRLNERFHKYITLFQGLATAIISAGAAVFLFWTQAGLSVEAAKTLIRGLTGLLLLLAAFVAISVVTGVFSWVDYRREESRLLDDVVEVGYRRPPNWRNIWRWHETYLIIFLIFNAALVAVFTEFRVLPLIQ